MKKLIAHLIQFLIALICAAACAGMIIALFHEMLSKDGYANHGMAAVTLMMLAWLVLIQGWRWAAATLRGEKFKWSPD